MEIYTTGTGQRLTVHSQEDCRGPYCVIHRPMAGPWDGWPTHWRHDRNIMERTCPHSVGHPAPEQFEHWVATDQFWQAIHGCDGCCVGRDDYRD